MCPTIDGESSVTLEMAVWVARAMVACLCALFAEILHSEARLLSSKWCRPLTCVWKAHDALTLVGLRLCRLA